MANILIVDDEPMLCEALCGVIGAMGHAAESAPTLKQGLAMAGQKAYDVVVLDVRLPDGDGLAALPRFKEEASSPEVIILTGAGDPDGAELAIRSGAWSYITKPPHLNTIRLSVQRAVEFHQKKVLALHSPAIKRCGVIGESAAIRDCLDKMAQAAATDANVLISGATGTGKELFARAIHENSRRALRPLVVVDCAAIPDRLVESELFGHEKGAFTGADKKYEGLILQADGGTLLLDEIGELPYLVQKAFLRVLQDRCFRPVGGARQVHSDFRLVVATNRNLEQMAAQGKFREDLLFRLRTVSIELPLLKDRRGDVAILCRHFLASLCKRQGIARKRISREFLAALRGYDWPGNVRELVNAVECSLSSAGQDPVLFLRHLPINIQVQIARDSLAAKGVNRNPGAAPPFDAENFPSIRECRARALEEIERRYLQDLLGRTAGNVAKACALSGLSRARLYALLKAYGLTK